MGVPACITRREHRRTWSGGLSVKLLTNTCQKCQGHERERQATRLESKVTHSPKLILQLDLLCICDEGHPENDWANKNGARRSDWVLSQRWLIAVQCSPTERLMELKEQSITTDARSLVAYTKSVCAEPGMAVHANNPSTHATEAGGYWVVYMCCIHGENLSQKKTKVRLDRWHWLLFQGRTVWFPAAHNRLQLQFQETQWRASGAQTYM